MKLSNIKFFKQHVLASVPIALFLAMLSLPVLAQRAGPILGHSVYGQGPEKVLVFHDWMGSGENYNSTLHYLNPNIFTYVFADVRGYGRSKHLTGEYNSIEVAEDAFILAGHLGWDKFHVVGHSMTGMVVQRMALIDWKSENKRLKSIVAITPVSANGYPADDETRKFLWDLINNRQMSQEAFHMLTGKRLAASWNRAKTHHHLSMTNMDAMRGYYRMWLQEDFAYELAQAKVGTPLRVIGGRQDLPGFQEEHLRSTIGQWLPQTDFQFITDAGHYPMQETPVYLATLVENFLRQNIGGAKVAIVR